MRSVALLGALLAFLALTAGCRDDDQKPPATATPAPPSPSATVAALSPTATPTSVPGPLTPTPLPAGLAEAVLAFPSPGPVSVWVYAGTPATANCDDLLGAMLPSTLFGSSIPKSKLTCQPGNVRYNFVQDSGGTYYLESVGILPIGLASLPRTRDRYCESIVDHLVPGSADPKTAAYVLVCDDRIPARGATPRTRQVWVRIVKDIAPAALPDPSAPCWETSRYLGQYTEAETVDVRCTLDE